MNGIVKQILGGILMCALLFAAAIPAGFMPNIARAETPDGKLYPLVLCTAYGEKTVYVPAHQAPDAATDTPADIPAHDETAHAPCPYAPATGLDTAAAPRLPVRFAYMGQSPLHRADSLPLAQDILKNWQAQAPPFS